MDYETLKLLQDIHSRLEHQETLRAREKAEQEELRAREKAEQEELRAREKAEQEALRAQDKAEQECFRLNAEDKYDLILKKLDASEKKREEEVNMILDMAVEQEQRLNSKLDVMQEQLTRIENHVLVIRGKVIPVDLDGITPETKDELQELCTVAYDQYVNDPNAFDPRLETQYDPRPDVNTTSKSDKSLHYLKSKELFRVSSVLAPEIEDHGLKVVFGDFSSKFSKAIWCYNFNGYYPKSTLKIFNKLKYYFFKERSSSDLVKTGRWT